MGVQYVVKGKAARRLCKVEVDGEEELSRGHRSVASQ